jgi:hypothetical protein
MAFRNSVERLVAMGPMPGDTVDVGEDVIATWTRGLDELEGPLTDDEPVALLSCFPPDNSTVYGLAWTLLHAIETAPYGPTLTSALDDRSWWLSYLQQRAIRSGIDGRQP